MNQPTEVTNAQHSAARSLTQPARMVAHDRKTHDVIAQDAGGGFYRITPDGVVTRGIDRTGEKA